MKTKHVIYAVSMGIALLNPLTMQGHNAGIEKSNVESALQSAEKMRMERAVRAKSSELSALEREQERAKYAYLNAQAEVKRLEYKPEQAAAIERMDKAYAEYQYRSELVNKARNELNNLEAQLRALK